MASKGDLLISELIHVLDSSIDSFNSSVPAIERGMYSRVLELIKELDLSNGRVKVTAKNMRILGSLKQELNNAILNKSFEKKIGELVKAYDKVESVQSQYFSTVAASFSPGAIFKEVKKQAIQSVRDGLAESGLSYNVTSKVQGILKQNITTGGRFTDLTEQMRAFLIDDKTGEGALARYSKQIVFDGLQQYSATYTQLATDDLGLNFFKYVGTLKETSREFCRTLIEAKNGCMPYIHRSQFSELLRGEICGHQVELNKKTDLPEGMKKETTVDNLQLLRGGWSCGHQLIPVSSAIVPKHLRERFE